MGAFSFEKPTEWSKRAVDVRKKNQFKYIPRSYREANAAWRLISPDLGSYLLWSILSPFSLRHRRTPKPSEVVQ